MSSAKKKTAKRPAKKKATKKAKKQPARPRVGNRIITPKQEKFCQFIAQGDLSVHDCAAKAGYSEASASTIASQTLSLPHVEKRIAELRESYAAAAGIVASDILREWARVGLSDIRDVLEVTQGGRVRVKPSSQWSDDAARAVAEVSEVAKSTGRSIKIKMHVKHPALDSLGKYLGLLIDRKQVEVGGKDGQPIEISTVRSEISDVLARLSNAIGEGDISGESD